jgi:hypothetical protein
MNSSIPSRFSEKHFQEMAEVIGRALTSFPTPIKEDPSPHSVETFARKFREAREAKRRHRWLSPHVNEALFMQHAYDLTVSMQEGYVLIGDERVIKATLKSQPSPGVPLGAATQILPPVFHPDGFAHAVQIIDCIDARWDNKPDFLIAFAFTDEQKQEIESKWDVVLEKINPELWKVI